jgi:hypothetical protein
LQEAIGFVDIVRTIAVPVEISGQRRGKRNPVKIQGLDEQGLARWIGGWRWTGIRKRQWLVRGKGGRRAIGKGARRGTAYFMAALAM